MTTTPALQTLPLELLHARPRLRAHASWHKHEYRGNTWYLLHDETTERQYYLTEKAHRLVKRFDGHTSVGELFESTDQDSSTQLETIELIKRLQLADLILIAGRPADVDGLYQRWQSEQRQGWLSALLRPLSVRIRLFNPQGVLAVIGPWCTSLFNPLVFIIWLSLLIYAIAIASQHGQDLALHASTRFVDPINFVLIWVLYPLIKGLHEFGHAVAIRHWGGRVREMGVLFLVFVPVPYVQASSASLFPNKLHRIVVGAAGILVELFLAALALVVFVNVQPGLVRDLAFNVTILAGVASVVFNANPLLRFDGYYVLADAIEIPNLATRSRQYFIYLIKHYGFGQPDVASPVVATGERRWFLFYAAASTLYRIGVSVVIAFFVASKLFIVGVVLAIWVLVSQWMLPLWRAMVYVVTAEELTSRRLRAIALTVSFIFALTTLVMLVPLPSATVAQGVVLVSEESIVRAQASGEIVEMVASNGNTVEANDGIVRLHDGELITRARVLRAKVKELTARLESQLLGNRVTVSIQREQLRIARSELQEVTQLLNNLTVKVGVSGQLFLSRSTDLSGRFVEKGQMLGIVVNEQPRTARVVVPQTAAERVRHDTRHTEGRFYGAMGRRYALRLQGEVPSGTHTLPSASLGRPNGGLIAVDARDDRGLTALSPVFQFDVSLPEDHSVGMPGRRILVRFVHTPETLGARWYRSLRALLLNRLEV